MGFMPTGGLVMGMRSGDLDPGVILFLLENRGLSPIVVRDLVNRQAGLLGVSGISSDMRDLLAKEREDSQAAEAVALFCYLAKKIFGCIDRRLGRIGHVDLHGGHRRK